MPFVKREFPTGEGVVALFWEAPGGGDELDINAPRNRPAKFPAQWLDNLLFHSSLDHMEVALAGTKVINHAAVPAVTAAETDAMGGAVPFAWRRGVATHVLDTHGLGYEPFAIVATSSNGLCGSPVQTASGGRARYVTASVTGTQLRISEWSSAGAAALPAIAITYVYLVVKRPPPPSGNKLKEFDPVTGILKYGRGRFSTDRRYLQTVPGGSPLAVSFGRTIDLKNGAARIYRADGTYHEPVPATLKLALSHVTGTIEWGASMAYDGSYAGPGFVRVQAP